MNLGDDASIRNLLDFIVTAQTAGSSGQKDTHDIVQMNSEEVRFSYSLLFFFSRVWVYMFFLVGSHGWIRMCKSDRHIYVANYVYVWVQQITTNMNSHCTMEKAHALLEMGFLEKEVSEAIRNLGKHIYFHELPLFPNDVAD